MWLNHVDRMEGNQNLGRPKKRMSRNKLGAVTDERRKRRRNKCVLKL